MKIILEIPDETIEMVCLCYGNINGESRLLSRKYIPSAKSESLEKIGCNHKKCYSEKILMSYPPKVKWICRICNEEGIEQLSAEGIENEYELRIKDKYDKR